MTQKQVNRFYERLVQLTGNDNIAREAGRYGASPDAMGIVRQYSLGLVGPANAFKLIRRWAPNLTKSATYESEEISPNKVKLTVNPQPAVQEQPFQCENRIGFWEALVMMLGKTCPQLNTLSAFLKGNTKCTYIISWKTPVIKVEKVSAFLRCLLLLLLL
ncbi:MAG: hypothetical protein R2864_01770 [Syntrophotaleaceae bacterium]